MGDYEIYNRPDYEFGPVPGTEDWQLVTLLNAGECYEWDEFHTYYSPSARRFFWGSGSGCSCNSFSDIYENESDFSNGSKADALRALKEYSEDTYRNIGVHEYETAVREIKTFKESK